MTDSSTTDSTSSSQYLKGYEASLMGIFGVPSIVIAEGRGCYITDVDGKVYLDLLAGIAVNSLGYGHPAVVEAITEQARRALHVSNFFTTPAQVNLAQELLRISAAPHGSAVFFCNSGTEANEAALKLARRTGRKRVIVADGAFHGRTMGALSMTAKAAYREPFEPLLPGIERVPYNDLPALEAALDDDVAAVILEPIQGEAGVIVPDASYLRGVRDLTTKHGCLFILDEVQTGIARTGSWFAHQLSDVQPDAMTLAKGLGGGVPIGALITFGQAASSLLQPGQHGTTFGGNPLACAAALAVLRTIEADGLLGHVLSVGHHLEHQLDALADPRIATHRGHGLLQAIEFRDDIAAKALADAARSRGFVINPVGEHTIRLAPPLIITADELDTFIDALPALLDEIGAAS